MHCGSTEGWKRGVWEEAGDAMRQGDGSQACAVCARVCACCAPPPKPMMTAAHAGTDAHPAVIDTRPASTPLHMHATSHCLRAPRRRSRTTAVMPPSEAEMVVVAKTRAAVAVAAPVMASVDPALKPYL